MMKSLCLKEKWEYSHIAAINKSTSLTPKIYISIFLDEKSGYIKPTDKSFENALFSLD